MNRTTKAGKKSAMVKVDATTKKRLAKSASTLSELAGAWVEAQSGGVRRR